ncbi:MULTISPECIES: extracellular solute-binding protein [unclassified Micromonospora]|uniref:extracellular solute-binding protein n=1 Tax=Micromonospora TaxID=1873 RepID=UPI00098CFB95|nr:MULTISPECIES: extracellular solute-binding protein [unclassified Micromonospora]MDI5938152.1 extracellular solute-binding protein [Micromonospora sp. DH15]OON27882.1 sugar ABC transporter substrate-binding protein [Micromonospora sp. Rc5]
MRRTLPAALLTVALAATAGCGDSGGGDAGKANAARGPITIWLSNNAEEVAWGKAMVQAWNAQHADQTITAQEIPAGTSSEEVIGAAITAGNAPCLIFNTAPAAVPQFQKQGGLVALDSFAGATDYITERTGETAGQYKSPDGKFYQLPWKSNPVMIFYNKKVFAKAGLDPEKPQLATYDQFLAAARKIKSSGAAPAAIYPAPTSEFFQSWFDFYPLFAAETGGRQLLDGGKPQFNSPEGQRVAEFWKTLYAEGLAPREKYNGDSFADGKAAMAIVGPWAISVYRDKVSWGAVPVPTSTGIPADQVRTFSDAKNVAMYSACQNRATAWDVLTFATSKEQDGALLTATGQMPLRADLPAAYPDYFAKNPAYQGFAQQAARTVEVPNVPNSVAIWQAFRDAYTESVIFGKKPVPDALSAAAEKAEQLAAS